MVCLMRAVVCVTQARRHTSQSWVVFTSTKKYFEVSRFLWNEMKLAEVAERRCGHLQRISHITSCYIRVVACYIRGVAWLTHTPHCSHQTDHRSGRSQNGQTATIIIILINVFLKYSNLKNNLNILQIFNFVYFIPGILYCEMSNITLKCNYSFFTDFLFCLLSYTWY